MKNYLIDTHTHINDIDGLNVDEIIKNAAENGVKKLVVPAAALSDFEKIINLCERYENVFGYFGIHSEELKDWSDDVIDKIKLYVKNPKIVGIGEIGLDYYWDKSQ